MAAAIQNYSTNYGTAGYNPTQDTSGVPENWAIQGHGVKKRYAQQTISISSVTDLSGSTYLLIKDFPADAILNRCDLEIDAGAGNTSASIGLYGGTGSLQGIQTTGVGGTLSAPVGGACYMSAVNIASATTPALGSMLDGLQALTHESRLVPAWYLAGDTLLTKKGTYDLVFTLVTGVTTAKVTAHMEIIDNG